MSSGLSMSADTRGPEVKTPLKLAYFCAQYPAISHTFVLKEVLALRTQGVDIKTFSLRRASAAHLLSTDDHQAYQTTQAILPPEWSKLLAAHAALFRRTPRGYAAALLSAMRNAPVGVRGRLWQLFYFVESVLLWHECRAQQIRHIHVHLANAAADVALLAVQIGDTTDVDEWSWSFTMHGPTEFTNVDRFRLAEKVRRARFVVCISDYARSQLMALSDPAMWGKLHVVHVGVPSERFAPPDRVTDATSANRILCVGRLVPEKGHVILLQAAAELQRRGINVEVDLVGEGPTRASLEHLAEELGVGSQIHFHGAVGQDDIRSFYARASLFCLPSFAEGIPGVLMEAMAMELPVISTRITGISELVTDKLDGLLVSPSRLDQLVDAILTVVTDATYARELGRQGRAKVLSCFNAATAGEDMLRLFEAELTSVRGG